MYFVAFCHDWCATVPECWLNVKTQKLRWPPKSCNPTMESKRATDPKDNWVVIKYARVLGPYSNYETARAVEIAAVDLSTNDDEPLQDITNQSDQLPQKRLRKKPAHLVSSGDDENADDESGLIAVKTKITKDVCNPTFEYKVDDQGQKNLLELKAKGPKNPPKDRTEKIIEDKNISVEPDDNNNPINDASLLKDSELFDYEMDIENNPVQSVEKTPAPKKLKAINTCEQNLNPVCSQPHKDVKPAIRSIVKTNIPVHVLTNQEKPQSSHVSLVQKPEIIVAANKDPSSTSCHTHCCSACRRHIETILREVQSLSMSLRDANCLNETPQNATHALPQFPIRTLGGLKELNKLLDDNAVARSQYKKMIRVIGGQDAKKQVRQILMTILNDDLACKLSWTGQKKSIGVKNMKFVDVFIEAMIASGTCTIHEVQTTIQSWLQHAGDRVRYIEKKHAA